MTGRRASRPARAVLEKREVGVVVGPDLAAAAVVASSL